MGIDPISQIKNLVQKFGGNMSSQNNIRKVEVVKNPKTVTPPQTPQAPQPLKKKGCNCSRRKNAQ